MYSTTAPSNNRNATAPSRNSATAVPTSSSPPTSPPGDWMCPTSAISSTTTCPTRKRSSSTATAERPASELPQTATLPDKPKWTTLFITVGKKDKVNKVDFVGFFTNKGQLKKEDIGLTQVKDFFAFVAIRKSKVNPTLQLIKNERLKNKKVKIDVAK